MWQVLLAAAVAGSGILAKRLIFNPNHQNLDQLSDPKSSNESLQSQESVFLAKRLIFNPNPTQPISDSILNPQYFDQGSDPQSSSESLQLQDSIFLGNDEEQSEEASIFRFSSTYRTETSRKKSMGGNRGVWGKMEGLKENGKGKGAKKCGVFGCEKQGWVVDQKGGGNGKRVPFYLKKRRTSKIASGKCQSCTSKANPLFSWGLSVGIMYMMSAGKAEISKLNNAMDETSKIVQELKSELSRRKTQPKHNKETLALSVVKNSSSEKDDNVKVSAIPIAEEGGECGSSVVMEEHQPEAFEMDQLEAELEVELQKLPWCAMECSGYEERSETFENGVPVIEFNRADDENLWSHQPCGVLPTELDQKLCHLLIEQQENQIVELESELNQTHSKLYEKEIELQTLKDCVKRLTEFSLGSASDEETDVQVEDQGMEMAPKPGRSMVGKKRAMDF